jgi:hypothetical protein
MGYLGYDPDALAGLRARLDALAAEAARTSSDDPFAADALARYHAAAARLAGWRGRVDGVLSCGVDGPLTVVDLDEIALADVLHPAVAGWTLGFDRDAAGGVHGERLAELVLVRFDALLKDPVSARRLANALDALDPLAATAFAVALGPTRAATLLDRVASLTALGTARRHPSTAVGAVLDTLARSIGRAWPGVEAAPWLAALAGLDPFTAGRLCRAAGLPTAALATVAGAGLARWLDHGSTLVMGQPDQAGELHPPQLLLDALRGDPAAGRQVVAAWPDASLARLFGNTTVLGTTAGPFLAELVDPRQASPAEAGQVLTRVLPALRADADLVDKDLHGWLGAAAAPWLDGLALGGVVGGATWSWGEADPVALLDWVARSSVAADAVAVGAAALVGARWSAVRVGDRAAVLYDLGVAVGTAQRAAGDGHVWVARQADAVWHQLWSAPGTVLGVAVTGPVGAVVGFATGAGVARLAGLTERAGVLGAPTPPDRVERLAQRHAADAKIDHAARIVRLDLAGSPTAGPPPPDPLALAPGPDAVARYTDELDRWVAAGGRTDVRADVHAFGDGFGDGFDGLAHTPRSID